MKKQYRITFNAEGLSSFDVCTLFHEAQDNHCDVSFSDYNLLIHIDTNDKQVSLYFKARQDMYSGEGM